MSDLGEPWELEREGSDRIVSTRGLLVATVYPSAAPHAVACVNALAGIANPAKQVERWKAAAVMLKSAGDPLSNLDADEIAALAAEWTPDE